jgi:hypothetical protein
MLSEFRPKTDLFSGMPEYAKVLSKLHQKSLSTGSTSRVAPSVVMPGTGVQHIWLTS